MSRLPEIITARDYIQAIGTLEAHRERMRSIGRLSHEKAQEIAAQLREYRSELAVLRARDGANYDRA